MVQRADQTIKPKRVVNCTDAAEELTASARPSSENALSRLLSRGSASKTSTARGSHKSSAMNLVPLLFLLSNVAIFALLRSSAVDLTQQLCGLSPDLYYRNTGTSGIHSLMMVTVATYVFWRGWAQGDSTRLLKPWRKALAAGMLGLSTLLDSSVLPIVLIIWPTYWLGSAIAKAAPQAMFTALPRAAGITFGATMLASFILCGLSVLFPLMASNGFVISFLGLLVFLVPPILLIEPTTCRNPLSALQSGLLVQLPLLVSGVFYTLFSGTIAALHSINYAALNAWMLSSGADTVITDAFPLWVKTGTIGLLTLAYAASAGLGGILGALMIRRRFAKLILIRDSK